MLVGLEMMELSAKRAFAEEVGIALGANDDPTPKLVEWMGKAVGQDASLPAVIEASVIRWLCKRLELDVDPSQPIDDLEAAVRRKIADDSHDFLFPFMEVGSAIAYLGPVRVVGPKLQFLESSTAGLIPSSAARERMKAYWQSRGAELLAMQDTITVTRLIEHLQEPLEILKIASDSTKASILSLSITVALSDGRFEMEEEQFTQALAQELKVPTETLALIAKEVSQAFWTHLRELEGTNAKQRTTGEELTLSMRAAQLTLESCGSLTSFSKVVEKGFLGAIHGSMGKQSKWAEKAEALKNSPLRIPLGFATGMLCFIRDRWKSDQHETLLRLALASIYQQHLQATGDKAEVSESDFHEFVPQYEVENPADILAETVVGQKSVEPVRKITLERTKFE